MVARDSSLYRLRDMSDLFTPAPQKRSVPVTHKRNVAEWIDCGHEGTALSPQSYKRSNSFVVATFDKFFAPSDTEKIVLEHSEVVSLLDRLVIEAEDWCRPDPRSIKRAREWLLWLATEEIHSRIQWLRPHVTAGMNGEVELEWWDGGRSLTVYFSSAGESYLESWGSDMDSEMAEGDAGPHKNRVEIWKRLLQ